MKRMKWSRIVSGIYFLFLVGFSGCSGSYKSISTATPLPEIERSGRNWQTLLESTPFPYLIALPEPNQTVLDGTYTKVDPKQATPVPCKRCPDYAPEGGLWKLNLDRGVYKIYHEVTGWGSMGSYLIATDRESSERTVNLLLFNDPTCMEIVGVYTWTLTNGEFILNEVYDPCAIKLRAMNLTDMAWQSCQPPASGAETTGNWQKPPGCD